MTGRAEEPLDGVGGIDRVERLEQKVQACVDAAVARQYATRIRLMALRIGLRRTALQVRPRIPSNAAGLPVLTLLALPLQAPFLLLAMGFAGPIHRGGPLAASEPAPTEVVAVVAPVPPPPVDPAPVVDPAPAVEPEPVAEPVAEAPAPVEPVQPVASCEPGRSCNPIDAEVPSLVIGSTRTGPDRAIDAYECAPEIAETGPEVWYRVVFDRPAHLRARLDENAIDGVDVDLQLLRTLDPTSCVERADSDLEVDLPAGTWYLVLDSCASKTGEDQPGPYRLTLDHGGP